MVCLKKKACIYTAFLGFLVDRQKDSLFFLQPLHIDRLYVFDKKQRSWCIPFCGWTDTAYLRSSRPDIFYKVLKLCQLKYNSVKLADVMLLNKAVERQHETEVLKLRYCSLKPKKRKQNVIFHSGHILYHDRNT